MIADVVIPVGPYHQALATEAVQSAHAQTLPVNVIQVDDSSGRGKAWARNEGVRRGVAPFLVFLDADDLLHTQFVEHTLAHYQQRSYVFTDWNTHQGHVRYATGRQNFFKVGMFHIITTLLPRVAFEAVGGFDETLPALEDEDLYYKLQAAGICGVRCPVPLVYYRRNLGRGKVNSAVHGTAFRDATVKQMEATFTKRYGHYRSLTNMCKTCNSQPKAPKPQPTKQEGDVLVRVLYSPKRTYGPVTGRDYGRIGLGQPVYMALADAESRPDSFEIIPDIETPSVEDVRHMAMRAMHGATR